MRYLLTFLDENGPIGVMLVEAETFKEAEDKGHATAKTLECEAVGGQIYRLDEARKARATGQVEREFLEFLERSDLDRLISPRELEAAGIEFRYRDGRKSSNTTVGM